MQKNIVVPHTINTAILLTWKVNWWHVNGWEMKSHKLQERMERSTGKTEFWKNWPPWNHKQTLDQALDPFYFNS